MSAPTPPKFGNLIREKTLPRINGIIVAPLALAFGYVAVNAGPLNGMSIGLLLFAAGLLAICAWSFTYKARIYEQGATVESIFGNRSLSFRDLQSFGYARIRQGAQLRDTLTFVPRNGKPLRIVTQPDLQSGQDEDLARLVGALTPTIAARLEKELLRTKRVSWVARVGGTVPPQRAVGLSREAFLLDEGGSTVTVPFADAETSVSNGLFIVSSRATGKRYFAIPCLAVNFYPGLALVEKLRNSPAAPVPPAVVAGP